MVVGWPAGSAFSNRNRSGQEGVVGKQGRRRLIDDRRGCGIDEVLDDVSFLRAQGGYGGEDPFDKAASSWAVGPEAAFSP